MIFLAATNKHPAADAAENPSAKEPTIDQTDPRLAWHSPFADAVSLTWPSIRSDTCAPETTLITEPSQIDVLLNLGAEFTDYVGEFFSRINVCVYNPPGGSFTVAEYHKALTYAHLFMASSRQNSLLPCDSIRISAFTHSIPVKLFQYLGKTGVSVTEKPDHPGVFYVLKGNTFQMQIVYIPGLDPKKYVYLTLLTNRLTMNLWNVACEHFTSLNKEIDEDTYNKAMNLVHVVLTKNPGFFKEEELIKMASGSSFIQGIVDRELSRRYGEKEDELRRREEEIRKRDEESRWRDEESRRRDEESRRRNDESRKRDEESLRLQKALLDEKEAFFRMKMDFLQEETRSQKKEGPVREEQEQEPVQQPEPVQEQEQEPVQQPEQEQVQLQLQDQEQEQDQDQT